MDAIQLLESSTLDAVVQTVYTWISCPQKGVAASRGIGLMHDHCSDYFLFSVKAPPPALASFLALSAARFSSLALPPLGLFFSDFALGFALKGSLGGILESTATYVK